MALRAHVSPADRSLAEAADAVLEQAGLSRPDWHRSLIARLESQLPEETRLRCRRLAIDEVQEGPEPIGSARFLELYAENLTRAHRRMQHWVDMA